MNHRFAVWFLLLAALPAQSKDTPGSWGSQVGPPPPSPPPRTLDWVDQDGLARAHLGWMAFAKENPGWQAIFDPRTGQLSRAFGPGIPILQAQPELHQVTVAALSWKDRLLQVVGVDGGKFELLNVSQAGPLFYADFVHRVDGFRVQDGRLTLRIDKQGKLVMWGGRFVDVPPFLHRITVGPASARQAAVQHLEREGMIVQGTTTEILATEPVVSVLEDRLALTVRPAWLVTLMTDSPRGDWHVYVDVQTAEIVTWWNDIRACGPECRAADHRHGHGGPEGLSALLALANVQGEVQGTTHDGLLPHQTPQPSTFRDIRVTVNGTNVLTDPAGAWSYNGGGATVPVSCTLDGPFVNGNASTGGSAFFSGTAASGTFNVVFTDTNSTIGERDMILFANKTHARLKQLVPTQTLLDGVMSANANVTSGTCNAFYSPLAHSINFYVAGGGCINTATSATVVAHEYGHGVTHRLYAAAGTSISGHLGEGFSDCISVAVEDTAVVGQGFSGIGSAIRNLNNSCQYPSSCGSQIHQRGLVIGGAYWHSRTAFVAAMGAAGKELMDAYLFRHLSGAPSDEIDSALEMLIQDDNDSDLTNGTPNLDKFYQGYTVAHGVPFPVPLLRIDHTPLADTLDQLQPYRVEGGAASLTGGSVSTSTLFWRVGVGGFTAVPMALQGNGAWAASIPNQAGAGTVQYYIRAVDTSGRTGTSPEGAPSTTHTFSTTNRATFFVDGFETPGGWTTVQFATQNDWHNNVHGNPNHAYDPPSAFEGLRTWGNDLVPASNWDGNYAANVSNGLLSPPINCTGRTGVSLVYRRWLTVEDAVYDQARIQVSLNGSLWFTVWQNAVGNGTQHHIDTAWVEHSVDLSTLADNQPAVRIRFTLDSDAGLQFGGWNIDDLRLESSAATQILTSSGSTSQGGLFNLHVNGLPGDLAFTGLGLSTPGVFLPTVGTLSLGIFGGDFLPVDLGSGIPAYGQITYVLPVPPAVGTVIHFQGLVLSAVTGNLTVSNVVSATIMP